MVERMIEKILKMLEIWKTDQVSFKKFIDLKNVLFPLFKTRQGKFISSPLQF